MKLKCKCQYYDEVSEECGYHGCPVTKEMKDKCDVLKETKLDPEVFNVAHEYQSFRKKEYK